MFPVRLKGVALAALLLATALPGTAARAADGDWLSALSGPLADAGYRLAWKSMTLDPSKGRVQARGVTSTNRAGRVVARIDSLAVDRPRSGPGGGWTADALILEKIEIADRVRTAVDRLVVTRPDLRSVARLMTAVMAPVATGNADARPLEVERVEVRGLLQEWTGEGSERLSASVRSLRITGLQIDPAAFAVAGDPTLIRPLSALAGVRLGLLEAEGARLRSSLTGNTEIARQWLKNTARIPGRSGTLQFGNEGMTLLPGGPDDPMAPLLAALFPPHGVVTTQTSGDVVYDVAEGLVDYRQRTGIDGFGLLDIRGDARGLPNLTVADWETIRDDDPRLTDALVNDLSIAVTDDGGVDRVIATMAADPSVPEAERRAAFAMQFDALGQGFNPSRDPLFASWLTAVRDFVRVGGTLALAAARPIPVAGLTDQEIAFEAGTLTRLANRYGLSLERR